MRNKLVKLALTIAALSVLPLLQGCDDEEDDPYLSTAWFPAYRILGTTGGGLFGLGAGAGTGTDTGAQPTAGLPGGTGGGNQVSIGLTQ